MIDRFFLGLCGAIDTAFDWITNLLFGKNLCECNINNGSGNKCKRCGNFRNL